jgi:hypothetical protein
VIHRILISGGFLIDLLISFGVSLSRVVSKVEECPPESINLGYKLYDMSRIVRRCRAGTVLKEGPSFLE